MLAFSEGIYNWIKAGHVLAAIVWVGGGIFIQIYVTRLRSAGDQTRLMRFAKDLEKLGNAIFLPASLLVLLFGIAMVWYSPAWEVTQLWVILGLVSGFIASKLIDRRGQGHGLKMDNLLGVAGSVIGGW